MSGDSFSVQVATTSGFTGQECFAPGGRRQIS
jgi:hypothetical protein